MKERWKEWLSKKEGKTDWFGIAFPLLLGTGVIFFILSNTHISKQEANIQTKQSFEQTQSVPSAAYEELLSQQLEEVLGCMAGVGKVQVLVTLKDDGEVTVLQDLETTQIEQEESDASGGSRKMLESQQQTETVRDAQDQPYVVRQNVPTIRGVLVLAEGAASNVIKQEILFAVQALLDIPADQIHIGVYQGGSNEAV